LPFNAEQQENCIIENAVSSVNGNHDNSAISGLKILIAEDDKTSEMLLDLEVKTFAKEIFKVRTGVEAVEACRNNPDIDLILMDIQMPEMSGYEAARQIRQFNKEVFIIAQTAYGLSGDREKAIEAGCNDYIVKPIKKNELLSLIRKYFK
jgi:CheY-like chemotaxis protein